MTPLNSILRAAPVVAIAGTICLVMPAYAGSNGESLRQMRMQNPAMNHREIRQLFRNESVSNNSRSQVGGEGGAAHHLQRIQLPQVSTGALLRPNGIGERINRFNGQSTFLTDNGRARRVSNGLELDLTSSDQSIVLGESLFTSSDTRTINVGGVERTLTSGSKVSAAEYVALQQVVNGGSQALTVDQTGRGIGGQFDLGSISDGGKTIRAAELVIPEHVTASGDFSRHSDGVRVTNDLINYGSINVFSSNKNTDTARIAARDINNNVGATISTSADALNLSLHADRDINNSGSIHSSGTLELSAGRSINNQGSINSNTDITLAGNLNSDLSVNNSGGTMSALNGAINVRSSDYIGIGNTTVYGGDFYSRELNLFTGQGTTNVTANQVTGVVNSSGTAAHVSTNTDTLSIGTQCLVGDPTYYNTGNIQLLGDITVGETLAIIAGGDITRGGTLNTIKAVDTVSGNGCDINIIAGANVVTGSGESGSTLPGQPPISNSATLPVSFTGASATGGNVDFSGTPMTIDTGATTVDKSGGNVTIAAYADSLQAKGTINIPFGSIIFSYGIGTGNNGGLTIVAGGTGTAINLGAQVLNNAGSGTTGDITIVTAQPGFSSGSSMTFDTTGAITTGNRIVPFGVFNASNIVLGSAVQAGTGNIFIAAGKDITANSVINSNGLTPTANGGTIQILSDAGTINLTGLVSANGGNSASGGSIKIQTKDDLNSLNVLAAFANGGTSGGAIGITNSGSGGVQVNGIFSAVSSGNGGGITVDSGSGILTGTATFMVDGASSGNGGFINLGASQISQTGNFSLSALGGIESSIGFGTSSSGIKTNGNNLSAVTSGTLFFGLADNLINADSSSADGGVVNLNAAEIVNANNSITTPLQITANGGNTGSGGQITYVNASAIPTFIGTPTKAPKGDANFLTLSAHAGANDGNGGSVTVDVGGNLTVNPNALNVAFSTAVGPHKGGTIKLYAGNPASTKVGNLVVLGDLNVEGINGGAGGVIELKSDLTKKTFTVGGIKVPKHGVLGTLFTSGASLTIENGAGIQLLNSIQAANIVLKAGVKGKISEKNGAELTAGVTKLTSDLGAITLKTNTDNLTLNTNAAAVINNVSSVAGAAGLLKIANGCTANGGLNLNSSGRISFQDITVATKGDLILTNEAGFIACSSFGSVTANNGNIVIQSKDVVTGQINFATGSSAYTVGKRGGNITFAVGAIPKKPTNSVPDEVPAPANFVVTPLGKGKTFLGANPGLIASDGAPSPTQVETRNKNVIFSNLSTVGNQIHFIGLNKLTAGAPIP